MSSMGQSTCNLGPTAALVMIWAKPIYTAGMAAEFVASLDMSTGEELCSRIDACCEWYGEVIRNRKYTITRLTAEYINSMPGPGQALVLAAGMSPISLQLIEACSDLSRSIEVDVEGMDHKRKLLDSLFPGIGKKISCVPGNICDKKLPKKLSLHGYKARYPTVVILEGISYYLSKQELADVAGMYRSPGQRNVLIIEYMLPYDRLRPDRRRIRRDIDRTIREYCDIPRLESYTLETLSKMIEAQGGRVEGVHTLGDMEKARLGEQRYFREAGDGFVECLAARI
jgi:hypothetical protein